MAIEYTNRRGEVYHLQAHTRKTGALTYSFSRKPTGLPVDAVPDGYEIFEEPEDAQVFVRKIKLTKILPVEKQLAENYCRRLAASSHCIVNVEGNTLVIYTSDADDVTAERLAAEFGISMETARRKLERSTRDAKHVKMLRFTLVDAKLRHFASERWCFRGSVDNWWHLRESGSLSAVLEKYVPHVGRESFFELH